MFIHGFKERTQEHKLVLSSRDIQLLLVNPSLSPPSLPSLLSSLSLLLSSSSLLPQALSSALSLPSPARGDRALLSMVSRGVFSRQLLEGGEKTTPCLLKYQVAEYVVQSKKVVKIGGMYVVVTFAQSKVRPMLKIYVYFPQTKRQFVFHLFKIDRFSAEIGLNKFLNEQGKSEKLFRNNSWNKHITSSPNPTGLRVDNRNSNRKKSNLKALFKYERENMRKKTKMMQNPNRQGFVLNASKSYYPPEPIKLNSAMQNTFMGGHNFLGSNLKTTHNPDQLLTNKRVLYDQEEITPQNVLKSYSKYDQKSLELIRDAVRSYQSVNLKHTKECIQAFLGIVHFNCNIVKARFEKFYTNFYCRCMVQMVRLGYERDALRVGLSEFEDILREVIFEKASMVGQQIINLGFYMVKSSKQEENQWVGPDTQVVVEVSSLTESYTLTDLVKYSELIKFIPKNFEYDFGTPSYGNLKIACQEITKILFFNFKYFVTRNITPKLVFLRKNLKVLMQQRSQPKNDGLFSALAQKKTSEVEYGAGYLDNQDSISRPTTGNLSTKEIQEMFKNIYNRSSVTLSPRLRSMLTFSQESTPLKSKQDESNGRNKNRQPNRFQTQNPGLKSSQTSPESFFDTSKLVLLYKKLFMLSPAVIIWLYLNKSSSSVVFLFHETASNRYIVKSLHLEEIVEEHSNLTQLLHLCEFYEAGKRIYSGLKNRLLQFYWIEPCRQGDKSETQATEEQSHPKDQNSSSISSQSSKLSDSSSSFHLDAK